MVVLIVHHGENKTFPMKGNTQFKALMLKASFSRKSKRTEHNKPGDPLKGAVDAALTFITTEIELLKANNANNRERHLSSNC